MSLTERARPKSMHYEMPEWVKNKILKIAIDKQYKVVYDNDISNDY